MRHAREDQSHKTEEAIDIMSAVKELHQLPSQELGRLLRDSEIFILKLCTEKGSTVQIEVEKLARLLPVHLIAVLISSIRDEALLGYMLRGFRLLHSLSDLAARHTKLEQILLDDVKISEQLLDLIFYTVIVLSNHRQENQVTSRAPLLHSALVVCSLYLLTQCISPQWQELVSVLLAHPKVDTFMDAAFRAVYLDIKLLQIKLSDQCIDSSPTAEKSISYLCQQCEASLQFLQTLCQQKMFRERLIRNKELSGKGGVLLLAKAVLSLNISPLYIEYSTVVAAVSRLKSKVLSILLHLCEVENISFLDEAFSTPRSQDLAKSVASQVLELLRTVLNNDSRLLSAHSDRTYPTGLSQLNALRLADIFSDDSNFRSHIAVHFTEVVTAIFLIPQGEFLSTWCSSSPQLKEEDAALEYDAFAAAGWVLDSFSSSDLVNVTNPEFSFIPTNMPQASYALQRTSLLVKVIANLHCFVPKICKEHEKNLFLNKFIDCLQMDRPKALPESSLTSDAERAATICKNMRSLLSHSESLIPIFLNEEDVQLFRIFFNQLQSLIAPDEEVNRLQGINFEASVSWDKFSTPNFNEYHEEAHSIGGCSSPQPGKVAPRHNIICSNLKEEISENSAIQEVDQNYVRGGHTDQVDDVMNLDRKKDEGKPGQIISGDLKETDKVLHNVETSRSDSSSARGKNFVDQLDSSEYPQSNEPILESGFGRVQEDEKVEIIHCEEKQQRKRKRTIMNDEQMTVIERALLEEPGMQRNSASVKSWADKLSSYGPEVTSSQLKNWLNNRKARLARAAAKDVRTVSEGDHAFPDKQGESGVGSFENSHDSPDDDNFVPTYARRTQSTSRIDTSENTKIAPAELSSDDSPDDDTFVPVYTRRIQSTSRIDYSENSKIAPAELVLSSSDSPDDENFVPAYARETQSQSTSKIDTSEKTKISPAKLSLSAGEFVQREPGQYVVLLDGQRGEIGKGKVHQVRGKWYGMTLEDTGTCVLDVTELKVEKWVRLPYPSEATGASFDETETKIGLIRVLWDTCRTYIMQPQ